MKSLSQVIRERIIKAKGSFLANDNISQYIYGDELNLLEVEVQQKIQAVLESLVLDVETDENLKRTAERIAKMYIHEIFVGRYESEPKIVEFPNRKNLEEMYLLGPMEFKSSCSHHFVPIIGKIWVGIIPSDTLIGISKLSRLITWITHRPQIQEEAGIIIADELTRVLNPRGVAIVIKAKHFCMCWRGVQDNDAMMSSSVMRGVFLSNSDSRDQFFKLMNN